VLDPRSSAPAGTPTASLAGTPLARSDRRRARSRPLVRSTRRPKPLAVRSRSSASQANVELNALAQEVGALTLELGAHAGLGADRDLSFPREGDGRTIQ
jgi:hypothetical protein